MAEYRWSDVTLEHPRLRSSNMLETLLAEMKRLIQSDEEASASRIASHTLNILEKAEACCKSLEKLELKTPRDVRACVIAMNHTSKKWLHPPTLLDIVCGIESDDHCKAICAVTRMMLRG